MERHRYASFDLEIAGTFPALLCPVCGSENIVKSEVNLKKYGTCQQCNKHDDIFYFRSDWKNYRPLGITCAAVHYQIPKESKSDTTVFWTSYNHVPSDIVKELTELVNDGYIIVTWNGLNFDFDVLAEESGMYSECVELALNHVDLMMIVVTLRGHYLGLDKAAKGANIPGKLKQVKLNDGTPLEDMSGGKAPGLWKAGEYQAVLDYLAEDVRVTLELAQWIEQNKKIQWITDKQHKMGYTNIFDVPEKLRQVIEVPKLYTVRECLELSRDTIPEWVTNPIELKSMMEWIK